MTTQDPTQTDGAIDLRDGTPIDPVALQSRPDVHASTEQQDHDDRDHCGIGTDGRAVIDVTNSDGEHLMLVYGGAGVAMLPNTTVDPDQAWLTAARDTVRDGTGISIEIDDVLAVRTVEHFAGDEAASHLTTHRVVFAATRTGGEILQTKHRTENGDDDWRVGWFDELPKGTETPPNGPANDFELVMD